MYLGTYLLFFLSEPLFPALFLQSITLYSLPIVLSYSAITSASYYTFFDIDC